MIFITLGLSTFILLVLEVRCASWKGLSFDADPFMCVEFPILCDNMLDDMGCSKADGDRIVEGCPNGNDLENWVGACSCTAPVWYDGGGTVSIFEQIFPSVLICLRQQ